MSAEPIETAVTGKPMDHYEPYVEMLSQVLANGLALTTDREFLLGLDRTVPLREAVRDAARDSIKWRFAFEIDRIEAAHDAEVRAGVVTEEPEWEYEVTYTSASAPSIDGYRLRRSSGMLPTLEAAMQWVGFSIDPIVHRRTKAVPAGEWERVDVKQEGPET